MPNLNTSILAALPLALPPLLEQRVIANILAALDDKIELNRRTNATLEAMARTLFQSWFVDFDPVRAKAEGRQPAGMDAATAELFPDTFEESALGEIPKGWTCTNIGEVANVNAQTIKQNYPYEVIEYIDIASVEPGRLVATTTYRFADAPSRARRLVQDGDTIWSTVRPNRRSYLFIQNPKPNLVVSTGFAVLSPQSVPPSFLYCWVTTDQFVTYLSFSADGSAYPAVLSSRFTDASILLPPTEVLEVFEQRVRPLLAKIHSNECESRQLADTRDALLPKLLSGELRVGEAAAALSSI